MTVSEAQTTGAFAAMLRDNRAALIDRWRRRVIEDPLIPHAKDLTMPALIDHVPLLLDRLIASLEEAADRTARASRLGVEVGGSQASHAHALERVLFQRFVLAEVLRELTHLRLASIELCDAESFRLDVESATLLHSSIDEMMATASLEVAQVESERAESASRAKDEFFATISHELRTPLNAISGWASILRTRAIDADMLARGLDSIERNAKSQTRLVEDLLDAARVGQGKLHLESLPLDFSALLAASIDAVRPVALLRTIRIDLDAPAGVELVGDPGRLEQVFSNLLVNAVAFSPPGARVEVRSRVVEGDIVTQVIDHGQGIAPGFLPHVFERFRQGDDSTTRAHGGLGLGLAIVHHLVTMHHGSIEATSGGPGQGATFTVTLPLPRAAGTPAT